jgi:hypothetical protein
VKLVEPPSCSSASAIVFIGTNRRGNWVAQEQNGLYGGLFVNRAQAVKYALFENGHHPEAIVELSREIELDMGSKRCARIEDDRIKGVFAAATGADQPKGSSVSKPIKRDNGLWKGLSRAAFPRLTRAARNP